MNTFLTYLLETSICLAMFYLVYILFRGDTFYQLKRIYLVSSVCISLIIPLIPSSVIPMEIKKVNETEINRELDDRNYQETFEIVLPSLVPETMLEKVSKPSISIFNIILAFYILGAFFFLFRLMKNLLHIWRIYKRNPKEAYGKYKLVQLSDDYPTFSFLNNIFLNRKNLSNEDREDVINHELEHIKQKHCFDLLFMELCKILFWFNPFIWFYKSSLVKVHECLADRGVIDTSPNKLLDYQSLLLKQYIGKFCIETVHSFNFSLVKYRIRMMTKNRSKWWATYKIIFAAPVLAFALLAFSKTENSKIADTKNTRNISSNDSINALLWKNKNSSIFSSINSGHFLGNTSGYLKLDYEGKELVLDFQSTKTKLDIEKDPNEIYDSSFKKYTTNTTSGKTHFSYETYALSNRLSIVLNGEYYQINSIDGACDMPISGMTFNYCNEKIIEYLTLYVTDPIILKAASDVKKNLGLKYGEKQDRAKQITIQPGSTLLFTLMK